MRRLSALVLVLFAVAACAKEKNVEERTYPVRGKIVSRDAAENTVRLDHENIPGFMSAMTMDFTVRGAKVESLPPDGRRVEGTLHVGESGVWLTDVKPID